MDLDVIGHSESKYPDCKKKYACATWTRPRLSAMSVTPPSPTPTVTSRVGEVLYATLNDSFDTAIHAVDEIYTANATMPGARDVDEDYDNGPQSPIAKSLYGAKNELNRWRGKSPPLPSFEIVSGLVDAGLNKGSIDDRKLLLEAALSTMSSLPKGALSDTLNRKTVALLYRDLPHPPPTFINNQYAWRQPDGSHNNPANPDLGKAGMPYARNVQSHTPMPMSEQPDPGLIFDSLLRRDRFRPHPAGNSALLFGFATLVIHTCFRTNHGDWTINDTSSYVDLSPLYGNSLEGQLKLRRQDGTGKMWNDVFAEDRLLFLPPISCALLVLFCRNHNYIAQKLLEINEKGRWKCPPPDDEQARMTQDDEIFNIARLINCGHFAGIVFSDYLAGILGLSHDANPWSLDPFSEIRNEDHTIVERGCGNANSVEFNLLYRWHATLSEPDVAWVERIFASSFAGKPAEEITIRDFNQVTENLREASRRDIKTWTFAGLHRGEDGKFHDSDIAKILMDATSHPAGAFGARHTPGIMRTIEIMTIQMARKWGVCTLNEFRKSLGLKPYTTFQEWNPDPAIWMPAQALYEQVDRLELYVGLQAEDTKKPGPGAGLCPGYTISRAILADAIALTRGDRFYTYDFTPSTYTSWGYKDCQRDPTNPGAGSVLGPLFLRTLPNNYRPDSVFTWFPMLTPEATRKNLTRLGKADKYTFERPGELSMIKSVEDVGAVMDYTTGRGSRVVRSVYGPKAREIMDGGGYFVLLDDVRADMHRRAIQQAIFHNVEHTGPIARAIESKMRALIHHKSFELVKGKTKCIDIVKDVVNLAPIHWIADALGLPLKTHDHMKGTIFEQQADQIFKDIYSYIFHEIDPSLLVNFRGIVKKHVSFMMRYIEPQVQDSNGIIPSVAAIKDAIVGIWVDRRGDCGRFYDSMVANGFSRTDVMNDVLALAVLATVELSHLLVHVINFYLEEENKEYRDRITAAAFGDETVTAAELEGYVREAIRLDPVTVGVMREITTGTLSQASGQPLQANERIFVSLKKAMVNEDLYPHPKSVDLHRSKEQKLLLGDGTSKLLGEDYILDVGAHVLKAVFSLKNLRRAPGPSGTLRRYVQDHNGTKQYFYLDQKQKISPWPTSMLLQYDQV